MIQIQYKIMSSLSYLTSLDFKVFDSDCDIEGFFELNVNNSSYGFYIENPSEGIPYGLELLTVWFSSLLKVILSLKKNNYVAINDLDSYNSWIEFKKDSEELIVSNVKSEKEDGVMEISTKLLENVEYGDFKNETIGLEEFKVEVINKSNKYFDEVMGINKNLSKSRRFIELKDLIDKVRNS